ncbi:MAG: hypothetical protein J7501_17190, partial [Bdellovibrio sp.]|nr:hypothetical protein [Bdellovibrio sp.]
MDNELRIFTTMFNWYQEEEEFLKESFKLVSPIRRRHKAAGYIKESPVKPEVKKITPENAFKFFANISDIVYRDLAMLQYYCAARIQEAAGIQIPNIHFDQNLLVIREVISWCNHSK